MDLRSANIVLESYSVLICLILLLYQAAHMDGGFRKQKRWFLFLLASNIGMAFGDMPDWLLSGQQTAMAWWLMRMGTFLLFLCAAFLTIGLTGYLIETQQLKGRRVQVIWRIACVLFFLQIAGTVLSAAFGFFYTITPDNVYQRGKFHILSQALPFLMYLLDVALIAEGRDKLKPSSVFFLGSFIVLPLVGQLLQAGFYGIAAISPTITLAILLALLNVQRGQEMAVKEKERELTEMRVEIMLSQIRPHFLYNTLTAIRQLCDADPARAKQSILDFSRFLRANMNSLTTKEPIPFTQELEHTKSYLNLERQRFGERLKVVYDTPVTEFEIPTLTLQPVAENAVRHGVLRREEGGTVRIATEEWGDGYVVIVADDGVGMDAPAGKDSDGAHIGLANVRSRLADQCGGTLLINSTENGTTVNIWIPKGRTGR